MQLKTRRKRAGTTELARDDALLAVLAAGVDDRFLQRRSETGESGQLMVQLGLVNDFRGRLSIGVPLRWRAEDVAAVVDWHVAFPDEGKPQSYLRAFCLTALFEAACEADGSLDELRLSDALIELILSLQALPLSRGRDVAGLLRNLLSRPNCVIAAGERALLATGLLWFMMNDTAVADAEIGKMLDAIESEAQAHFLALSKHYGLTVNMPALPDMSHVGVRRSGWISLADAMAAAELPQRHSDVVNRLGVHAALLRITLEQ